MMSGLRLRGSFSGRSGLQPDCSLCAVIDRRDVTDVFGVLKQQANGWYVLRRPAQSALVPVGEQFKFPSRHHWPITFASVVRLYNDTLTWIIMHDGRAGGVLPSATFRCGLIRVVAGTCALQESPRGKIGLGPHGRTCRQQAPQDHRGRRVRRDASCPSPSCRLTPWLPVVIY